jgi:signal transduction histidine kinase
MRGQPVPRHLAVVVLLAMAGFAAVGFFAIRRDVENLRVISQDNTQWSATQMEIELLRFRLSLADLLNEPGQEALDAMHERFDILWSRVFMMGHGRLGDSLTRYDGEHGSVATIAGYLQEIDPLLAEIDLAGPGTAAALAAIKERLDAFQQELRQYTLRVMRAEGAAGALMRERIQTSARTTAVISIGAVLLSVLALFLILRENRRQRQLADMSRRSAEQAELASRAKSRFLSMMSHELRNPLNGILGPLALLGQSELAGRQQRLVVQAQQSGQSMVQMLSGLLDYGEVQDGRFRLKSEPFGLAALAELVRGDLGAEGAGATGVSMLPGAPERVYGDLDRLRQIFVHLALYVVENRDAATATITFGHDGANLTGDIAIAEGGEIIDWKLDLLMDLTEISPDQVTAEALRPLISRGLIAACNGVLTLGETADGRRIVRVSVPSGTVRFEQIRVHLETGSAALAAIYKAALRSDRVAFVTPESSEPVDIVLVDSTRVGELPLMSRLRARFPSALFVSLGLPQSPDFFDDIVETPNDMSRLRTSILGRLAS